MNVRWIGPIVAALTVGGGICGGQGVGAAASPNDGDTRQSEPRTADSGWQAANESTALDASPHIILRRLVHRFDFDDPTQIPYVLPRHFFRILSRDGGPPGFPDFGSIAIASDDASSGQSSLRFELEGGSMAVTFPPGILNVLPRCDYMLAASVRTHGLRYAHACIVATLHDDHGNPIPDSVRRTELVQSGQWTQVTLAIPGRFDQAASLVLELQVLQPRQFAAASTDPARPVLEDVMGTVWFDDVTIWQIPRAELRTCAPGNVLLPDEARQLELELRDLSSSPLTALLRVLDLDGRVVFEDRFDGVAGRQRQAIALPALAFGWYEAQLTLHDERSRMATQSLTFALVPRREEGGVAEHNPFGVAIEHCPTAVVGVTPDLLRRCGVGSAMVPIWSADLRDDLDQRDRCLRDALNRMLDDRMSITLGLLAVPPPLHGPLGTPSGSMLDLARRDLESWRRPVEQMLFGIDQTIESWLVGPMDAEDFHPSHADADEIVSNVASALGRLVPHPRIHLARAIEQSHDNDRGAYSVSIVPFEIQPQYIIHEIPDSGQSDYVSKLVLELPPVGLYEPRARVVDAMLRGLYAWRGGAAEILIRQPWRLHLAGDGNDPVGPTASSTLSGAATVWPDPVLPAWRTLADQLRGRQFLTELHLIDGVRCWVVSARDGAASAGRGMLIAWNEHASRDLAMIDIPLATGDVDLIDGFGNRRSISPRDNRHTIPIGDAPVFIDGIDLEPAIFRARLALHPAFVPSIHRVHERVINIHNPWLTPISGSIRFHAPDGWMISPGNAEFTIAPRTDLKLPVSLVLDRSVTSGLKTILADISLQAERDHVFKIPLEVEVGLEDFRVTTAWNLAPNLKSGQLDLIITQAVTNRSDRLLTLDASVVGDGLSLRRRTIADLAPGQTATRTFRIDGGAALLAGKHLRIGVAERGGIARLNQVIEIPRLGPAAFANQTDE